MVPTPFLYPQEMQPICEEHFEKDILKNLRKAFTVNEEGETIKAVCILDVIPLPFKTFQRSEDFLVWSQKSLCIMQYILASILRLHSVTKKRKLTTTEEEEATTTTTCKELNAAKFWYEQFSTKYPKSDVYEQALRLSIQHYIMEFPMLVYEHICHFPSLSFEKKLELMCSLNFSACKIFLSSLWNHKGIH